MSEGQTMEDVYTTNQFTSKSRLAALLLGIFSWWNWIPSILAIFEWVLIALGNAKRFTWIAGLQLVFH